MLEICVLLRGIASEVIRVRARAREREKMGCGTLPRGCGTEFLITATGVDAAESRADAAQKDASGK